MKGLRRRARVCAAAAGAGAAVLAAAAGAHAQGERPASVGDGIKTGQMSVQLFNYGSYIGSGATVAGNPITGVSAECATATTAACRYERLDRLFAFLASKGVTSVELFGHGSFPQATAQNLDVAGFTAYRALLDKHGLHAAGWHGDMNEANWDARIAAAKILGADYLGSGGVGNPGIGSYANTLLTAQALNRMGKKSVEAGVGPVYIHNHTGEFDTKYVHEGELKTAWDILMEETDPRYVAAELDVFWSSDAFDDVSGTKSAELIEKYPNRIQMLHIKDGVNITLRGNPPETNSRGGSPRATGTGELDFRPIFASAVNRIRYYHQEHDGGTTTDATISLTNLKGTRSASVGTLLAKPTSFPTVPAGTPAAANVVPVVVQNTGDQPLTITNIQIQADLLDAPSASDFAIVSQNCTAAGGGGPLAPGAPATDTSPAVPRGTCTVNVGFKPTRTNATSVARLQFTSNSDNATERVLLVGRSTGESHGGVGGDVPPTLALSIPAPTASFGTFVPGIGRDYDVSMAASVTHTAGDAALTVTDPSTNSPGRLVNGTFALAQPLKVRAAGTGEGGAPYLSLSSTAGEQVPLKSWSAPVTNDPVTLGFRQSIGATEALRTGTYSKTLTFTLSTTTP